LAAKGFHATSTRDIAAAAGLCPAAVYVFYKSKEELLYSIAKSGHELYLDVIWEAVARSSDPIEQLTSALYAFTRSHRPVAHPRESDQL
jgi:AcrR family transcriptional regulator